MHVRKYIGPVLQLRGRHAVVSADPEDTGVLVASFGPGVAGRGDETIPEMRIRKDCFEPLFASDPLFSSDTGGPSP